VKDWVCFNAIIEEGPSIPLAAFDNEEKAKAWCEDQQLTEYENAYYEELEIK